MAAGGRYNAKASETEAVTQTGFDFSDPGFDPFDVDAGDFFVEARAANANPDSNVIAVDPSAQRFRGVVGSTLLSFEMRFAFDTGGDPNFARGCSRIYPFVYNVKRSDGALILREPFYLLVLPPAQTLQTTPRCPLTDLCI